MPRLPAEQARKLLAVAVQECKSIPSLAQVVLFINEAEQHAIIEEFSHCEKLLLAERLIRRNTGIRI